MQFFTRKRVFTLFIVISQLWQYLPISIGNRKESAQDSTQLFVTKNLTSAIMTGNSLVSKSDLSAVPPGPVYLILVLNQPPNQSNQDRLFDLKMYEILPESLLSLTRNAQVNVNAFLMTNNEYNKKTKNIFNKLYQFFTQIISLSVIIFLIVTLLKSAIFKKLKMFDRLKNKNQSKTTSKKINSSFDKHLETIANFTDIIDLITFWK
jgi:hypothetical protein